jgi:Xaa-Pro aminopeptidase
VNYKGRQAQLRSSLAGAALDALLVTHLPNIRYLCGFTGSAGVLLVTAKQSLFFTDSRYTSQAKEEVSGARTVVGKQSSMATLIVWLKSAKKVRGLRRVGFDAEHVTFASHRTLAASLSTGMRLRPAAGLVERARMIKDAEELQRMRAAALLGAGLFGRVLEVIRPGVRETEVAAEMERSAFQAGAEGMSFPSIIAAGKRSALPHGRASNQPIPGSGFVVCDFGVILTGYCSDMTRTVHVGPPSEEARSAYGAVREAQQAAIEAIRPGRTAGEVDGAARKILQRHKLGRYFTHSTGHGVGLEIHEAPRVATGQKEELKPGMVITVEPGVYLAGKWGIRIEDMVLVTERGGEVLTPASKELIAC